MRPIAWKLLAGLITAVALAIAAGCNSSATNATGCESVSTCGPGGTTNMTECVTNDAQGVCIGKTYKVGTQSWDCHSCIDCAAAQSGAAQACASVGSSSSGSSGSGSGGNGNCSAKTACGTTGVTYQECTKTAPNGSCQSITYETSDGHSFTCAGCTSCQTAASQLAQYCANPTGSTPTTTCTATIACGSSGLTYQQCTTTLNGACQSSDYQLSDGSVYACAGCGNCSAAQQQLQSYCASQSTTTSCSSAYSCGTGGATYQYCETLTAGSCTSITYETSTGYSWQCNSCSDCSSAYSSTTSYCSSLGGSGSSSGGTGGTCGTTTCGSAASCCDCSGTYECITIPAGYSCADYGCTGG